MVDGLQPSGLSPQSPPPISNDYVAMPACPDACQLPLLSADLPPARVLDSLWCFCLCLCHSLDNIACAQREMCLVCGHSCSMSCCSTLKRSETLKLMLLCHMCTPDHTSRSFSLQLSSNNKVRVMLPDLSTVTVLKGCVIHMCVLAFVRSSFADP